MTSLLLARATGRAHETAISVALGASRTRIARQALAESLLLALAAAVVGSALATVGLRALIAIVPPDIPRLGLASIDLPVLLATFAVAVCSGMAVT